MYSEELLRFVQLRPNVEGKDEEDVAVSCEVPLLAALEATTEAASFPNVLCIMHILRTYLTTSGSVKCSRIARWD